MSLRIATGALYIWGGVAALRGRTVSVLVVAAVLQVIIAVGVFVMNIAGVTGAREYGTLSTALVAVNLLVAIPILILTLLPSNRGFFAARGL